MSKHSSTWETLALNIFFPPLAFVAKKELLSIPFFGWAFALASPITIDRKAGTDAMQQIVDAGPRALPPGLLVRRLSRRARGSRPARAPSTRPAARGSRIALGVPIAAGRAQRRLPLAQGYAGQAAGNRDDLVRQADRARRQDRAGADQRSRSVDRKRSRPPRQFRRELPVDARRRAPGRRLRDDEGRFGASPSAGQDVDYRLIRARRRSIGMQIGLPASPCAHRAGSPSARSKPRSPNAPRGSCARSPRGATAAATCCRANGRAARRFSTGAASSRSRCARRRNAVDRGRPVPPDGAASVAARRAGDRRVRRPLAQGRGAARCSRRASPHSRARVSASVAADRGCRTRAANGEAATTRARSGSTGGWSSCRRTSPTTSSRTRSRICVELNHSRAVLGAGRDRCFPGHAAARRALGDWTALLEA